MSYCLFRHQTVSHMKPVRTGLICASKAEGVSHMRDVYSAVADPTRRRLLRLLADADELPLHELTVPVNADSYRDSECATVHFEAPARAALPIRSRCA